MEKQKKKTIQMPHTYVIIFGFVLGSLPELFPGWPSGGEIFACILTFLAGFAVIVLIMIGSDKAEKTSAQAPEIQNK